MCGIIGIVSRPPTRATPDAADLVDGLDRAVTAISALPADVVGAAAQVCRVDELLRGLPGVLALSGHVDLVAAITARLDRLDAAASDIEYRLDSNTDRLLLLDRGRVQADGSPFDVLRPETLTAAYRQPVVVMRHPHRDCPLVLAVDGRPGPP